MNIYAFLLSSILMVRPSRSNSSLESDVVLLSKKMEAVFEQTERYAEQCEGVCSAKEYECFDESFFSKRKKLDRVRSDFIV